RIFAIVRRWRIIRVVGVVQMDPHKFSPGVPMLQQPRLSTSHYLPSAPLDAYVAGSRLGQVGKEVIVVIEAAIETGSQRPAVKDNRAYKGGCNVAVLLHHLS